MKLDPEIAMLRMAHGLDEPELDPGERRKRKQGEVAHDKKWETRRREIAYWTSRGVPFMVAQAQVAWELGRRVRRLKDSGTTFREMARCMGVSGSCVASHYHRAVRRGKRRPPIVVYMEGVDVFTLLESDSVTRFLGMMVHGPGPEVWPEEWEETG